MTGRTPVRHRSTANHRQEVHFWCGQPGNRRPRPARACADHPWESALTNAPAQARSVSTPMPNPCRGMRSPAQRSDDGDHFAATTTAADRPETDDRFVTVGGERPAGQFDAGGGVQAHTVEVVLNGYVCT
jgi:hypothetical protein